MHRAHRVAVALYALAQQCSPDRRSVLESVTHTGALLIGTYDNFAGGDLVDFLECINRHIPTAAQNTLLYIERTGHTYQQKQQEVADLILGQLKDWAIAGLG